MVTVALGIPCARWIEARAAALTRLLVALGVEADSEDLEVAEGLTLKSTRLFTDKEPNWSWSAKLWSWGAATGADWLLELQDDVEVDDGHFWAELADILEAVPADCDLIGLETAHEHAPLAALTGRHFITTNDGLIGVGYLVRRSAVRELLRWRGEALREGGIRAITEDTLIDVFAVATGRKVWHPVPTIIDHDTSIASTYGNDAHTRRRPTATWKTHPIPSPRLADEVPHMGNFYAGTVTALAIRWLKHCGADVLRRVGERNGVADRAELLRQAQGRTERPPRAFEIKVCTPVTSEGIHPYCTESLLHLQHLEGVEAKHDLGFSIRSMSQDVVRVRSRMVREFLEGDATHLLFVDRDVSFETVTIAGMLTARREFVQCPYPRRDGAGYTVKPTDKVRFQGRILDEDIEQPGNVVKTLGMGLGLTLLSRACLEKMVAHYAADPTIDPHDKVFEGLSRGDAIRMAFELGRQAGPSLVFVDVYEGKAEPTVALFQLLLRDSVLFSEDTSFCQRWSDMGQPIYMYVGAGSPAHHTGEMTFRGDLAHLGLARPEQAAQ